nr:RnfABCDGE type electron transport complex subunit G [Chitinivorax tropicus]
MQRAGLVLLLFSLLAGGLLATTHLVTRPIIEAGEREALLAQISQVLPKGIYDNDLLSAARPLSAAENTALNNDHPTHRYLATWQGKPSAVVMEATAPDGYAGRISLLIGILADGTVSGVRVLRHKETPGLGDYIQLGKAYISQGRRQTDWVRQLDSQPPQPVATWAVRKAGGKFDYMAGATISPRAVLKAVGAAQQYAITHRAALFRAE